MTNDNNNPMYRPAYEDPIWNASHIGSIPIDLSHKKDGWGFLMNKGRFEMFPIGDESFYDHNKLKNYNADEHVPLSDTTASTRNLWSAKKTKDVIEESRLTSNKTLNKAIKDLKEELGGGKDFKSLLNGLESAENDLSVIKNVLGDLSASQPHNVTYTIFQGEIAKLEGKLVALVNQSLKKTVEKTEINKKFKEVEKTIKEIDKAFTKSGKGKTLSDKEILKLIEDRALWGHEHLSKEIKHDGQRLSEYLETISVGDSLPDQAGNSGKFLTTDGSDASWASLPGGGDMAAATYDPTNKSADAFNVDNHASGSTNKVFTGTEQTKLSGIEDNANNYSLPTASGSTLGGVKVGARLTMTSDTLSADSQTDNNFTTTLKNKLDAIEASADVTDAGNIGSSIHGATEKTTPVDADTMPLIDSAASNVLKKVSWLNIKTTLKSYFDSIYQATGNYFDKTSDDLDDITAGSTNKHFTSTMSSKLSGIEDGAEVNTVDSVNGQTGVVSLDIDDVAPSQTGNNGKVLKTDGTNATWQDDATGGGGVSDGDKGDITVSSSGATWTIDNSAVTYAKMQNVSATDRILGRDTAGAGVIEELSPSAVRSMINVADGANNYSHPNHSGDVTSSGDGATTIANSAVTLAKMANLAANTIIGRVTASTGVPEALTAANVRTIINVEDGADVTDATNVNAAGAVMETDTSTASIQFVVDEDNMASNSATKIPTQQSVKAYADSVAATAANISTSGGLIHVNHGATAGTSRPSVSGAVIWVGSAEPSNASNGDIWIDVS